MSSENGKEPFIVSEIDQLLGELQKPYRFLLFERDDDDELYSICEKHLRKETRIAWVNFDLAETWVAKRDSNGPYCGSWVIPEYAKLRDWVECDPSDPFKKDDVVEWREGVWDRSGAKPKRIGDIVNIGTVVRESDDQKWVWIKIEESAVAEDEVQDGRVRPLAPGVESKRARSTIYHGAVMRLLRPGETSEKIHPG
jgi:hypothetical protein